MTFRSGPFFGQFALEGYFGHQDTAIGVSQDPVKQVAYLLFHLFALSSAVTIRVMFIATIAPWQFLLFETIPDLDLCVFELRRNPDKTCPKNLSCYEGLHDFCLDFITCDCGLYN